MSSTTKASSTADQVDEVQITGEKRKADSSSNAEQEVEAGGKDLVETKQTTLDDVIQHEKKESESVPKPQSSTSKSDFTAEGGKDEGPAAKKTKIDSETRAGEAEEGRGKMDIDEVKAKGARTPPSQLSQTEPLDRPHKSVKRVDNIADKPITGTPTKSINRNVNSIDNAVSSSSSPLKPTPTNGNGNGSSRTDGVKGVGSGGDDEETVPGDEAHLDHPENWTTGDEPATEKQKGYLKVLESQKGVSVGDISSIGKSEASEKIDQLVAGGSNGDSTSTTTTTSAPAAPAPVKATAADSIEATTNTGEEPTETTTNAASGAADAETVPGDEAHLDHPENWTTGGEPATDKQKGFLKVLEKQKGVEVGDISSIGKSEASEKIDELKNM